MRRPVHRAAALRGAGHRGEAVMTATVVLAGNPNTGKTSLFNALTDSYEYVGNWPGVTVEKKVGRLKAGRLPGAMLVDLPGVYSLNPLTADEEVAARCLLRD